MKDKTDKIERIDASVQLADWRDFYKEIYDMDIGDIDDIDIPPEKEGFDRLIVVPKEMNLDKAYFGCRERVSTFTGLMIMFYDMAAPFTGGKPSSYIRGSHSRRYSTYAIWARNRAEADEELIGVHADDLRERLNIKTMFLLERFLFEIKYFIETGGKHLDELQKITNKTGRTIDRIGTATICPYSVCYKGNASIIYYEKVKPYIIDDIKVDGYLVVKGFPLIFYDAKDYNWMRAREVICC